MTVTNAAFWCLPPDDTVREALAALGTSLTLAEAKAELHRHLLDRRDSAPPAAERLAGANA